MFKETLENKGDGFRGEPLEDGKEKNSSLPAKINKMIESRTFDDPENLKEVSPEFHQEIILRQVDLARATNNIGKYFEIAGDNVNHDTVARRMVDGTQTAVVLYNLKEFKNLSSEVGVKLLEKSGKSKDLGIKIVNNLDSFQQPLSGEFGYSLIFHGHGDVVERQLDIFDGDGIVGEIERNHHVSDPDDELFDALDPAIGNIYKKLKKEQK